MVEGKEEEEGKKGEREEKRYIPLNSSKAGGLPVTLVAYNL